MQNRLGKKDITHTQLGSGVSMVLIGSGIQMTVEDALAIQAKQIEWYSQYTPNLAALVAAKTKAHLLTPGVPYDIVTINDHIPRGHDIERLCGLV